MSDLVASGVRQPACGLVCAYAVQVSSSCRDDLRLPAPLCGALATAYGARRTELRAAVGCAAAAAHPAAVALKGAAWALEATHRAEGDGATREKLYSLRLHTAISGGGSGEEGAIDMLCDLQQLSDLHLRLDEAVAAAEKAVES